MTLPGGWKRGQLGEECSIEIGGTPSRDIPAYWDDAKETTNLWVSIRDLNQREITRTAEQITTAGIKHSNVKRQPPGTILLSFKLTIGRVAVAGMPLYTNEAIAGLRSTKIVHDYLYHGLHQWDLLQGVDQAIKGATLNKAKLKKIEFDFPESKTEQAKIADILSTIDRSIEQTDALIAKQEKIKTGLMQDLLTRGIDEHGKLRSEQTHRFNDSPAGRIPVEWVPSTLERVGTWMSGGTPSKANPSYWGDEVPWVCPKDMKTFTLSTTIDRLTRAGARHGSREVPRGSVFIVVRGMILAHTFPVTIANVPMTFNQDVRAIVPNADVEGLFLAYWLTSHGSNLLKLTTTATHGTKRFDMKELYEVPIGLPKKDEQSRIISRLDAADAEIEINKSTSVKLSALKTGLMQDLLTGRRRVTALSESTPKREKLYAGQ